MNNVMKPLEHLYLGSLSVVPESSAPTVPFHYLVQASIWCPKKVSQLKSGTCREFQPLLINQTRV